MIEDIVTRYKLRKQNRLHLSKQVNELFEKGSSFISYPIRVVYTIVDSTDKIEDKVLVAVAKKYHKRANKRNRIKRLIRENYRLTRHKLTSALRLKEQNKTIHIALMCVCADMPDYETINRAIEKAFKKIIERENTK